MTQLTERQAWEEIAEAHEVSYQERNARQRSLSGEGCCFALTALKHPWDERKQNITEELEAVMLLKIEAHLKKVDVFDKDDIGGGGYFCPTRNRHPRNFEDKHDKLRANFCREMALSCEDEKMCDSTPLKDETQAQGSANND